MILNIRLKIKYARKGEMFFFTLRLKLKGLNCIKENGKWMGNGWEMESAFIFYEG